MRNMTPEESKMFAEFVRSEMAFSVPDSHLTTGMSLRAYIAIQAMPAIIGLMTPADAAEYKPADLQAATARAACGYADKLISELGKGDK
jgi:hypothetical protein